MKYIIFGVIAFFFGIYGFFTEISDHNNQLSPSMTRIYNGERGALAALRGAKEDSLQENIYYFNLLMNIIIIIGGLYLINKGRSSISLGVNNDKEKLRLMSKYNIKKDLTLNKFIVVDKIFNDLDDALIYAATLDADKINQKIKTYGATVNSGPITQDVIHEGTQIKFDNFTFIGERLISNDKYKLFLVEKYQIKKNEVLNQYLCDDKLFTTVDEALAHAATREELQQKEITERELLRVQDERKQQIEKNEKLRLQKKKADEDELQKQIAWKAGAPKRRIIFATTVFLAASSAIWWYFSLQNEIHIKSNSIEFSGAKLGGKIKDYKFGDELAIDGGPYFFTKNHALLSYELDGKIEDQWKHASDGTISGITFECHDNVFGRSIGLASIDGFSCSSSTSELISSGWKKLCSVYDFNSFTMPLKGLYLKNNAFFEDEPSKNSPSKISSFGLRPSLKSNNAYQDCSAVEKLKIKAKKEGYKSLGDMMTKDDEPSDNLQDEELNFFKNFDKHLNVCMACRSYAWLFVKDKPNSECSITISKALNGDISSKEKLENDWWQVCPQ